MKAEHRKELETNYLADRMGQLVQRVKSGPQKRTVIYIVLFTVAIIGFVVYMRIRDARARENSERWFFLENGATQMMDELRTKHIETNPGKAATFQYAWLLVWDRGIKRLGADPQRALEAIKFAEGIYLFLTDKCKGDAVWEPELMYAQAVIQETYAVVDSKQLQEALTRYKNLVNQHPKSGHAQMAKKRVEQLEDPRQKEEIAKVYRDLKERLEREHGALRIPNFDELTKKPMKKDLKE